MGTFRRLAKFVCSIGVRSASKQMRVFVEIIPHDIIDIVSKSFVNTAQRSGAENDLRTFKSSHDAIIEAQNVGLSLLGKVKPENLLFIFGQTVESLQSALREFCETHSITYPSDNCYGPIYPEHCKRNDKNEADPMAIVLCKLMNADLFQDTCITKQQNGTNYCQYYKVSWSELQNLQKSMGKAIKYV